MKFKGFANEALNLGCIDVKLTTAKKLEFMCCVMCDFATAEIFRCDCDHGYCGNCLLVFEEGGHEAQVVKTTCVVCQRSASCMKITLNEAFVGQLQCHCPQCQVVVRLSEMKGHLKCCMESSAVTHGLNIRSMVVSEDDAESTHSSVLAQETSHLPANKQVNNGESSSSQIDTSAMNTMSVIRRELVDMIYERNNAINEQMNIMKEEWLNLPNEKDEFPLVVELTLRDTGTGSNSNRVLLTTSISIGPYEICFRGYSNAVAVTMLVTAGDSREEQNRSYEVAVSGKENNAWRQAVTKTVENIQVGMSIQFDGVFYQNYPKDQSLIKVELKHK